MSSVHHVLQVFIRDVINYCAIWNEIKEHWPDYFPLHVPKFVGNTSNCHPYFIHTYHQYTCIHPTRIYLDAHPMRGFSHLSWFSNSSFHSSVLWVPDCIALRAGTKILATLFICSSGIPLSSPTETCGEKLKWLLQDLIHVQSVAWVGSGYHNTTKYSQMCTVETYCCLFRYHATVNYSSNVN